MYMEQLKVCFVTLSVGGGFGQYGNLVARQFDYLGENISRMSWRVIFFPAYNSFSYKMSMYVRNV